MPGKVLYKVVAVAEISNGLRREVELQASRRHRVAVAEISNGLRRCGGLRGFPR